MLEHACKADYTLITRTLEMNHRKQVDELEEKVQVLNKFYIEKEEELKVRMAKLDEEFEDLDLQRTNM